MKAVYHAESIFEAHTIRDYLVSRGIQAWVVNDDDEPAFAGVPLEPREMPTVMVDEAHAEKAARLIAERETAEPED